MRLRVEISTAATEIPWERVLKPGRAVCYDLLAQGAPELGPLLHEKGWGRYGMVPFGFSGPVFPGARRRRGAQHRNQPTQRIISPLLKSGAAVHGHVACQARFQPAGEAACAAAAGLPTWCRPPARQPPSRASAACRLRVPAPLDEIHNAEPFLGRVDSG